MDRYRLQEEKFGREHVLSELVPIFADTLDKTYLECIKRYEQEYNHNYPVRKLNAKPSPFKYSPTVDRLLRRTKTTLLENITFEKKLSQFLYNDGDDQL